MAAVFVGFWNGFVWKRAESIEERMAILIQRMSVETFYYRRDGWIALP